MNWAVFVSGQGTNLQNFLNLEPQLKKSRIVAVHADKECPAVERARKANKKTLILNPKEDAFTERLHGWLVQQGVDHIFLLGYMRILSADFLEAWENKVLNLHPSLLPHYKGLHSIRRAYEAGEKRLGVSIHLVTPELDSGAILCQKSLIRAEDESFEALEARIHQLEYEIVQEVLFDLESGSLNSLV